MPKDRAEILGSTATGAWSRSSRTSSSVWSQQHPIATVLIGITVVLVVFVPLATNRFKKISSR